MNKFYLAQARDIIMARRQHAENIDRIVMSKLSEFAEYQNIIKTKINLMRSSSDAENRSETVRLLRQCDRDISAFAASKGLSLSNYICPLCCDTGHDNEGVKCQCLIAEYNKIVKEKMVGFDAKAFTFADSNPSKFPSTTNLASLYPKMNKYCKDFPQNNKKMLFICGNVGVGKSYLASAMANCLIERNYSVNYLSAFNLNNLLVKHHTNQLHDNGAALQSILTCDALFIDDLGTEPIYKNVTAEYLYNILESRENKHTFITSNLDILSPEFTTKYGERIFSRVASRTRCALIKIVGEDLRLK